MANDTPKTPREAMEQAARELEAEALTRRFSAGNDPQTPLADVDDEGKVYEIPPEHQIPPQQVIEEENLGVKK